nr:cation-chloride cotransporter 1-like [Tanacetum cinerariifolium]
MRNEDIEGSEDDEMSSSAERGQSYGPVVTQDSDPVVLEMSSFDPGSPSKAKNSLKSPRLLLQDTMKMVLLQRNIRRIVGIAGISESLVLVALCGLCTFMTAVSLSAIATNGAMKGGGPYYLIGRALGPEVGVSIGLCFFLGNAVAGAMYVLGAVETFLSAVPEAGIFRGKYFTERRGQNLKILNITFLDAETVTKDCWHCGYKRILSVSSIMWKVKSGKPSREEPLSSDRGANGAQGESKLELFGFDSLVNILGLKSMTGEQIPTPTTPRYNEDGSSSAEHPKGGGPYYLIGRALGPEVGVSIGLCFFLGNAVAGAMYVLGAVETFLSAVPEAGIFRETVTKVNGTEVAEPITTPSLHDLQIYGIVVTVVLG